MSQNKDTPEPGMPCPECKFFMKMSITDLLSRDQFKCPGCGTVLVLKRDESKESMKALQDLDVAIKNADAKKKQSL